MNKIRTVEKTIETNFKDIVLRFILLSDDGEYKIMIETDYDMAIEKCKADDILSVYKIFDTLVSNDVTAVALKDVLSDFNGAFAK